jgi:tetratricopeptide (TPR) repeat protein
MSQSFWFCAFQTVTKRTKRNNPRAIMVKIEELDKKRANQKEEENADIPTTTNRTQDKVDQFNDLFQTMQEAVDENPRLQDRSSLLGQAIELALAQGRGWGPGEKEAYLERILADDFIPPLFANTQVEVERSGLQPAFTTLIYDDESPTNLMKDFKKKGNDAFANGKRNVAKNMQYYRDAINFWLESLAWAEKIRPFNEQESDDATDHEETYSLVELNKIKSTLSANIAQAHLQLSNWGLCRDHATIAVTRYDPTNVKAWYRLAQAQQRLQQWEEAGEAIDQGLAVATMDGSVERKELLKLQTTLADRIRKARQLRQERERKRAERVARVKAVWKHCQQNRQNRYTLGKVPLVASASDDGDDDDDDEDNQESLWHHHLPHSGMLPSQDGTSPGNNNDWSWPCLFVYPSHQQSDFIAQFGENEMLAMRMAEVFPELDDDEATTRMPWDTDNQFTCSNLVVYFEVHEAALEQKQQQRESSNEKTNQTNVLVHPEAVQYIGDQGTCMRFYEASRALKGDEGADIAQVVRLAAQGQLRQHQRLYKQRHGSLWAGRPAAAPVVQVHPAVTLRQVLADPRMVVPNFLVTFILLPEAHPAHVAFLQEHQCIGVLQPGDTR